MEVLTTPPAFLNAVETKRNADHPNIHACIIYYSEIIIAMMG